MPLFGKRKQKLQAIIDDATVDSRAYDRLYEAIPLNTNAAKETFQHIIQNIVVKQNKETKLRDRLIPHRSSSISGNNRKVGIDPDIRRSILYMTVLHGVVWSFPYTMNMLFTDQETCSLILKLILSTVVPLTVRETMLSMVSNWCVLYQTSLRARLNLEGIVDTVKEKINLRPIARLMPTPPYTLKQDGWRYPESDSVSTGHNIYREGDIQAHGSMPTLTPHGHPHGQMISATFNPSTSMDPVFLSQQRELMNLYSGNNTTRSHYSSDQPADGTDSNGITSEFITHMEESSRELGSLCDMLTETLISLNVEEDPSTNSVVKDMMSDTRKRKDALTNFIGMLGSDHMDTLSKLTETIDTVDRCMWLYDKTLNSHNEWKAIQQSLQDASTMDHSSHAIGANGGHLATSYSPAHSSLSVGRCQAESSQSAARLMAAASSSAMASTSKIRSGSGNYGGSSSSISGAGESQSAARTGEGAYSGSLAHQAAGSSRGLPTKVMSSKARGKMAETLQDGNGPDKEYFGSDSAYGGSGEQQRSL
ncbi:hypothetical protein COEREDRAFT_78993 [Coemansia reversa NRRL 1564]|uniref:Uncharacterized protein n=1 Tax=Coemansia reversa (strain ATCC 12441 / NRRL 1564) TaxID=763665 RepID=A0A2G5BL06_COERN|nr:hypothetical protein COEREDRAFT_78993 [Coemansia reversa NRRL 1564]|eukprot:PIA19695.1 hypothetical protein COEREDRAFT_78993 [Coemansia reversa NRRL 1564]